MSLRRVRCPQCLRLFDVTGVAAGTRLRCGRCTIILKVPVTRALPFSAILRIAAGFLVGVVTVAILGMALRPSSPEPAGAGQQRSPGAAPDAAAESSVELGIVDDPVSTLTDRIRREFPGSRFSFSDKTRPYFIALESSDRLVDPGLLKVYAEDLDVAHTAFRRDMADRIGLPPVKDTLFPVVILASRQSFDRYCEKRDNKRQPAGVKGFYEYDRRRIVTYSTPVVARDVLNHEGTHQLLHYYLLRQTENRKVPISFWMQEGLATYSEGYRRRLDGEVAVDRAFDSERLPLLKHVVDRKDRPEFVPLSKLLSLTVDGYWDWVERARLEDPAVADRQAQIYYAEAWALVHFLRQSGARYRKVFDACVCRELAGTGSREAFEQIVRDELGIDLVELEAQFLKHLK